MQRFLVLALLLATAPVLAADKQPAPTAAAAEINHLLDYLAQSRCQFERNGRWHGAGAARAHLERKLRHGKKRHKDPSAEYFIEHAATGSSLTGKPYQVRCPGDAVVASADWFRAELQRYRREQ